MSRPPVRQPAGLQLVAGGFTFPTSVTFDDEGTAYIAEAGLPFGGAPPEGRVWRLDITGERSLVADGLRPPVNGLHLNMAVVGPDGKLYFSQGAMTNLGIAGLDAYEVGWLRRLPHGHDVPGFEVTLAGVNVATPDPTAGSGDAEAVTGAFVPFGTPTEPGRRIPAGLPATASVMRCNLDGSGLELVAWGLRNAFGLGFLPDGRLLAIGQGADDRGSRPIGAAPDLLFEVRAGAWYGWPDYVDGVPVTDERFRPERGPHPPFVLADHQALPPPERALLAFPPHVAAVKFDLAPPASALSGSLLVALFGDEAPMTAPRGPRVGRGVAAVNTTTWQLRPLLSGDPLRRPIDVRVHDHEVHVLDFGEFEMTEQGVEARAGSGRLWRLRLPWKIYWGQGTVTNTAVVKGTVKASGSVLRCNPDGTGLELVAWVLRNPYGTAFHPDGRLFATEHGIDERNARHIIGELEDFYEIVEGAWYGWPDFASGIRLDDPHWGEGGRGREPLLAEHPDPNPPKPFVTFPPHAGPNGVNFCRSAEFGFEGDAFVALFGDITAVTARRATPVGFKVVRVDITNRRVVDFAVNKIIGPSAKPPHSGFDRPSHCAFGPDGALYIVDWGEIQIAAEKGGIRMPKGSGSLWRIRRTGEQIGEEPPQARQVPSYAIKTALGVLGGAAALAMGARALLRRARS